MVKQLIKKYVDPFYDSLDDGPDPSTASFIKWIVWVIIYMLIYSITKFGTFWLVWVSLLYILLLILHVESLELVCWDRDYLAKRLRKRGFKIKLILSMYMPMILFFVIDFVFWVLGFAYIGAVKPESGLLRFWIRESPQMILWLLSIPTILYYKMFPWIISNTINVFFVCIYTYAVRAGFAAHGQEQIVTLAIAGTMLIVTAFSIISVIGRMNIEKCADQNENNQ